MPLLPGDPLCTTGLASEIKAALVANCPSAVDNGDLNGLAYAIASTVVAHIKANAVVMPTALVAPPGAAGGPVTGVGSVQ